MSEQTEEIILRAAQRVFTQRGYEGARMQQIADEAGVNKSMLHYYYRSKKGLFQEVYHGAVAKLLPQLIVLLNSDLDLEDKIPRLVEQYISRLREYPRLPGFILQEVHQNPEVWLDFIDTLEIGRPERFLQQVREKQERGEIISIDPKQLLINILSMCVFPFAARPMIKYMLDMDETEFECFLEERKKNMSTFILNAIQP